MGRKGLLRTADVRRGNGFSDSSDHCSCFSDGNTVAGEFYSSSIFLRTACGMRAAMAFLLLADPMVSLSGTDHWADSNVDPSFCGNRVDDNYLVVVSNLYVFPGSNRSENDVSVIKNHAKRTSGTDRGDDICAAADQSL